MRKNNEYLRGIINNNQKITLKKNIYLLLMIYY